MKQALALLTVLIALFQAGHAAIGYHAVYQIAHGAIALMALMIAATYLWLYALRATPLALGMAYGWAGTGFVLGWWWIFDLAGRPGIGRENPVLFALLPFYFVGAVLHFAVIHRSFGRHGAAFLWPILTALGLSAGIYLLI